MYEHLFSHCATEDCVFWFVHCTKRIILLNEHFNFFNSVVDRKKFLFLNSWLFIQVFLLYKEKLPLLGN